MALLYVLRHDYVLSTGKRSEKLIGMYTSKDLAEDARARTEKFPGFIDYPQSFFIDAIDIDADLWPEGFEPNEKRDRNLTE